MSMDVRIHGYFSKPKGVCGQKPLGDTDLEPKSKIQKKLKIYKNNNGHPGYATHVLIQDTNRPMENIIKLIEIVIKCGSRIAGKIFI
jgi:hypothetical protein